MTGRMGSTHVTSAGPMGVSTVPSTVGRNSRTASYMRMRPSSAMALRKMGVGVLALRATASQCLTNGWGGTYTCVHACMGRGRAACVCVCACAHGLQVWQGRGGARCWAAKEVRHPPTSAVLVASGLLGPAPQHVCWTLLPCCCCCSWARPSLLLVACCY